MDDYVSEILKSYHKGRPIDLTERLCRPARGQVSRLLEDLKILLFPGLFRTDPGCAQPESYLRAHIETVYAQLEALLIPLLEEEKRAGEICREFLRQIPRIRDKMQLDLEAFLQGDPAAEGAEEILVSYPGYDAIGVYRLAHSLYALGVPLLPRMMTELAHSRTGIDIHPGADIGESFFIDHGTGVVIGQTAVIGHHGKLYQGVTLGALSTRGGRSLHNIKRHPTLEDHVTVYAGATILGGDTVVGRGATIGANAFVTSSVTGR